MAVYTDVAFEDLEAHLTQYDIGAPQTFKGIAEGVENSNYYLGTDKGAYILTLYEKRVSEEDLPFFLGLMQHLSQNGLACPTPLVRKDGALWGRLNGRACAILTFLNGVSVRRPSAELCMRAGEALAQLHRAGASFPLLRGNSLGLRGWPYLVKDCAPHADGVAEGLRTLIESEMAALQEAWPENLPQGVIHADLFPDNVLFMGGNVSGLIDFYFACNDALAYDLAVMLNAWCFESDGQFNVTNARALVTGYQSLRPLNEAERAALPILSRGAALRFLLTRLYDWVNQNPDALVRPKDPRDFMRRLRFHRSVRGPEAYGL